MQHWYTCHHCGMLAMETTAPISLINQDDSPYPLEGKVICKCGHNVVEGKGAITIDGRNGTVVIDGHRNPRPFPS